MKPRARQAGRSWATNAVSFLLACGVALPQAHTQDTAIASPELAQQKIRMLETLFESDRLRKANESRPQLVEPVIEDARSKFATARHALDNGQVAEAVALLDDGIRMISRAVAIGSQQQSSRASVPVAFVSRRRQAESYLAVLESADGSSASQSAEVRDLRSRLEAADAHFADGNVDEASRILEPAYAQTVKLVAAIWRGQTIFVEKSFKTPRDEFEYERERNKDYGLLVEIAVAERGEDQPTFAALAARVSAESERIRHEAEAQAAAGDYSSAINSMERASERLLLVLRAAGVILMDQP